jgi:phosphoglycerate dehydrogenase-like enzyme
LVVSGLPYIDSDLVRQAKCDGASDNVVRRGEPHLNGEDLATLAKAEVLLALDAPLDLAANAPRLRWVQGYGAGVGQLARVLDQTAVTLTTAAGVAAPAIAEFVLARLLQVWKNLRAIDESQLRRNWEPHYGQILEGRTLGIVGFGGIGSELASRATAFGMRVLVVRRDTTSTTGPDVEEMFPPSGLVEMLRRADAVVIAAPATPETRDLIGARELAAMRTGSVLCNVARGSLVNEFALLDSLRTGRLAAAILDVTADEPLPSASPLWTAPGVYLSAHCSVSLERYDDRLLELFADNLDRYFSGKPLRNVFRHDRGY